MKSAADRSLRTLALLLGTAALAGCGALGIGGIGGGGDDDRPVPAGAGLPASPEAVAATGASADYPQVLGEPYSIEGRTFVPADTLNFDEVGYAELGYSGTPGPDAVSAAHRTLPLPSYVEVTALDSGRTALVRVTERGPYALDRVISLSPGAARQLGIAGFAPVRVRRVNPPEQERAALRAGMAAAERLETPPGLRDALRRRLAGQPVPKGGPAPVPAARPTPAAPARATAAPPPAAPPPAAPAPAAPVAIAGELRQPGRFVIEEAGRPTRPAAPAPAPAPAARPAPAPAAARIVVQVGAFSTEARAQRAARSIGGFAVRDGRLWHARMGPYADAAAARQAKERARRAGYRDARILDR